MPKYLVHYSHAGGSTSRRVHGSVRVLASSERSAVTIAKSMLRGRYDRLHIRSVEKVEVSA